MATTTLAMSTWQYSINGSSWQQGSGHDISIGVDGSNNIYRGYVAFSLSNFSASYLIQNGSLFFKRADSYGRKTWAIGLTDTKPKSNFDTSSFKHTISSAYQSDSGSDNTISLSSAQLTAYVGKTVYVLFLAGASGNTYGEIETDAGTPDKRPALTVNYNYAKSTINTASDGTIGSEQVITITQQDSSYTHTLTATCAGRTATIATKVSDLTLRWTPQTATYAPRITTAMSASCTYTLTTYYGNQNVGSDSKTVTLTLPSSAVAPTLSLSVTDNNGYASHFNNKFIVGKSAFKVVATPTYQYQATLSSLTISANGATYSSSPAITSEVKSGKSSISATVKDSRSQTANASTNVTLLAYDSPSLSVSVKRCKQNGTTDSAGAYCKVRSTYTITPLDNINTKSLVIKYRPSGGSETTVPRSISNYSDVDEYIFPANTELSYVIEVALGDYFTTATVSKGLSTASVVFDLYSDGKGMAFGKVATDSDLLDIAWDVAIQNKGLRVYDSIGTLRAVLNENGNMSLRDANGDVTILLRGDGGLSGNPLPIGDGGSGQNSTATLSATASASTGSISVVAKRWGNVVNVYLTCKNGSSVSAMNYFARGTLSGVPFPTDTTVATTFSSGDLCACSINASGTITSRVMVGTVSANTNRVFAFTYIV